MLLLAAIIFDGHQVIKVDLPQALQPLICFFPFLGDPLHFVRKMYLSQDTVHPCIWENDGTDNIANLMIAQLLFLQSEDAGKDIQIYINSPGGSVTAGMAIYDTMEFAKPDVTTTCVGMAASMGAVLLAAGTKGKRFALPHSRILLHQPTAGFRGQASDIDIHAREVLKTKEELNTILALHTGKPVDTIAADTDRDFFMSSPDAKQYGIVDQVIASKDDVDGKKK